jgi:Tol biopolymer transport system component
MKKRLCGLTAAGAVFAALGIAASLADCVGAGTPTLRWTDETPSWAPDGRAIVFASDRANPRGSVDQLYAVRPDGNRLRRLTDGRLDAREPSFSPDGTRIVYAANVLDRSNDYTEHGRIYAMPAEGGSSRLLSRGLSGDSDHPVWSPDGRSIAFFNTAYASDGLVSRTALYVVRSDGSELRELADNVDSWSFAWSPTGRTIALSGADERLYLVPLDATRPLHVRGDDHGSVTTDIAWSPDGKHIALVRGKNTWDGGGDRSLWMRDVRTGRQRRLRAVVPRASIGDFQVTITWLPGRRPLLALFDDCSTRLLAANGQTIRTIAGSNELTAGSASPNGRNLVLVEEPSDSYLAALVVATAGGGLRRITQTTAA